MPQIRLAYVSRRAPHLTDDAIVDDIVLPAMAKNRRLEITGCLWFDQRRFLQVLEGPAESVEGVFASIVADSRHTDVDLIRRAPDEQRSFARWAMKPVRAGEGDPIGAMVASLSPESIPPRRRRPREAPTPPTPGALTRIVRLLAASAG